MSEQAEAAPPPGHARASSRRTGRRAGVRATGRSIVLFASLNALVSLILPWIATDAGGASAFALGRCLPLLGEAAWLAWGPWVVTGLALAAAALALADRVRPLGAAAAAAAVACGSAQIALGAYAFSSVFLLRQVGALACALGGLVHLCGAAMVLRGGWEPARGAARSILARPGRLPWVTAGLVVLNVIVFVATPGGGTLEIARQYGLIAGSPRWHTFVTSQFLHAGWAHVLANMAVLLAVGVVLERVAGRIAFASTYVAGGVAGAATSALIDPRIHLPLIGSSGAVAGAIGLCVVLAPRARVRLWFHAAVIAGRVELQAAWLFSAWILLQAVGSFYLAIGEGDGIGYWGHLGGAALGLAAGGALRRARGDAGVSPHPHAEGAGAAARRASRHARGAFESLPLAFTGVAFLVSIASAVLTGTSGSLPGTLTSFARAWNAGRLDEVAAHFRPDEREARTLELCETLGAAPPDARPGIRGWRIGLRGAREGPARCGALFVVTGPAGDPYRTHDGGRMHVTLAREAGRWWVTRIALLRLPPAPAAPCPPMTPD